MNNDETLLKNFEELQEQLKNILPLLSKFEQDVLSLRFGLVDGYSLMLSEVADYFGISVEQIQGIEGKALELLKHQF